jgi:hypothetical protein
MVIVINVNLTIKITSIKSLSKGLLPNDLSQRLKYLQSESLYMDRSD